MDQVEEREEREQRPEDQQRREQDIAADVALQRFHRLPVRRARRRSPGVPMGAVNLAPAAAPQSSARTARSPKLSAKQQHDDEQRNHMREQEPCPQFEPSLRDQALHDVEAVAVEHVQERRRHEVERAAHSRIDIRERHGKQRQHEGRNRNGNAPEELGALDAAIRGKECRGRDRLRGCRQRPDFVRFDPASELLEFDYPVIGRSRVSPGTGGRAPAR